jgi:uncharacterized protein YcfL
MFNALQERKLMNPLISATLTTLLIAGCSSSNDSEVSGSNKEIVNNIHQPLEKANAVEQEILDRAEMQRKQMEDL